MMAYLYLTLRPLLAATEAGYAAEFRVYKYRGGVYGFIGNITETSSVTYTVNNREVTETRWAFEDKNIEPDTEDTPPTKNNPFNGSGKYPSIVFLHQQRLGFAASNSRPMTIWLSQAGNYENMSASLPPEDDDSIEVTLSESQANKILWCQSDRDALAVGTEGGEWLLSGTDGSAITPSYLAFKPQTYHGSQPGVNVLRAGSTLLYLQRGGKVVREFGYAFSTDKYESNDLSLLARHILRSTSVKAWAWQAEPYGIVWCVLGNGNLAALTYMREHDVVGWHRHNSKDGEDYANFIDIAAIPGSDGNTQIWTIVQRSGTYRMERLHSFFNGGSASDAFHTDGSSKATFNARCKPTLPEAQLNNGTTFLKIRKFNAVKCRIVHSSPFYARVGSETKMPVPLRGASYVSGHADWALPLGAGWRENEGIELIFDGSDPVTVLGIVTTVEVADMSGNQQL